MSKIFVMVGLPASGKSTYAKELAEQENANIHSSDNMRKILFGDENINDRNEEVFSMLHKQIKLDLIDNKNVVYDATNINYKRRKAFLKDLGKIECEKICILMATPYEKCLEQNKLRDRQVPEEAIKRMYLNFYIPQYYEGWDNIKIVFGSKLKRVFDLFNGENGLNKISQDNPHHTLTIGEHCDKCLDEIQKLADYKSYKLLFESAVLHDIGKRFTKEFKNYKGEKTDIAHYYSHHLVSAYDSLFYPLSLTHDYCTDDIIERANYIQWHMQPFFMETEKAKNKFIKLVGQEFYDNLMILHQADLLAH